MATIAWFERVASSERSSFVKAVPSDLSSKTIAPMTSAFI